MTDKVPIRTVFDSSGNATGLAEFQSGETVGHIHGGTGLSSLGSAGQVLKVNAAGNAIEFGSGFSTSSGDITLDSAADIILDADGADVVLKDGGTEFGRFTNSSGQLVIKSSSSTTTAISMSGANVTIAGNLTVTGNTEGDGNITIGDAATDTVTFGGTIQGSLVFEGSSADSFETTLTPGNPSADITLTLPASASDTLVGLASTQTLTNKTLTTPTIAEIDSGSTITLDATTDIILDADGANITMKDGGTTVLDFVLNGTTDVTLDAPGDIKLDADGGDVFLVDGGTTYGSLTATGSNLIIKSGTTTAATFSGANVTLAGTVGSGAITSTGTVTGTGFIASSGSVVFEGSTADSFETTLTVTDPTADRTITLPNLTGTVSLLDATETLTNKTLTSPVISTITGSTITLDSAGDITFDADGADVILKDGGTEFGRFTNNGGELRIASGASSTTNLTMSGANTTIAGNLTVTGTTTSNGSTITLGDASSDTIAFGGTISTNLVFEGSTADSFETTLAPGNPTADITLTLPTSTGSLATTTQVFQRTSTIVTHPAASGDVDLADSETPFVTVTDAFGIALGSIFDHQDPAGSVSTVDLGSVA